MLYFRLVTAVALAALIVFGLAGCPTIDEGIVDHEVPPTVDSVFSQVVQACSLPWGKETTQYIERSFAGSAQVNIREISANASVETRSRVTDHARSWFEDEGFIKAIGLTGENIGDFVNLLHNCIFEGMGWGTPAPIMMFYRDRDGDRYGTDDDEAHLASGRPEGFASYAGDCADNDPDVFPGQERWFTKVSSQGNYDFDCDGQETRQYVLGGSCRESCGAANEGWLGGAPACGEYGRWLNDCDFKPFRGGCIQETQNRPQACR